jgi:hypothetical protein
MLPVSDVKVLLTEIKQQLDQPDLQMLSIPEMAQVLMALQELQGRLGQVVVQALLLLQERASEGQLALWNWQDLEV